MKIIFKSTSDISVFGTSRWCKRAEEGTSRHLDSSTTTQMAKIMVQYGRPSLSSWATSIWQDCYGKSYLRKSYWKMAGRKFQIGNVSLCIVKKLFFSVYVDDIKLAGKKQNLDPMWKVLNKEVDLGEPTSFLDHVYLGCTQRQCEIMWTIAEPYSNREFPRRELKSFRALENFRISSWSVDMESHAKKCVERYCELSNKTTQQLHKVFAPCINDHNFTEEEMKSVEKLSHVCS